MKNEEARFLLAAYRPDGRDAGDPRFVEPLARVERDPGLRAWFERERNFDATVARKLAEIHPPAGLREAILAGVRASRPRRRWWPQPAWLAAAAGLALLAAVAVRLKPPAALPATAELTAAALRELADAHDNHEGHPPALASVQAQLATVPLPLTNHLAIDLNELRGRKCRAVRIAGREVFEICFQRDGAWYHVYVARRADFAPGAVDPQVVIAAQGGLASAAWADSQRLYALVTDAGAETLGRLL